jgi:hypothetical protein
MRFPNLRYGDPTEFAYYAMGRTHAELARMLRRDERTIRDWLSGRAKVPWWVPEIMQRLGDLTTCDDRLIYRCYNVFNKVALLALERAALPSTIKMFGSHFHSPRTAATIVFRKEHRTQEQEIAPNTNQGNTPSISTRHERVRLEPSPALASLTRDAARPMFPVLHVDWRQSVLGRPWSRAMSRCRAAGAHW